jgi:hypothetical protein
MLLLVAYIALGATGRLTWRQAGFVSLGLTAIVIAAVMVSYSTTTPTDKYIRALDATVYATGNPYSQTATTPEDLSGVKAATWSTTDHSAAANTMPSGGGSSDGGGS